MADIIRNGEGFTLGSPEVRRNRFLLDGEQTGRRITVVEHTIGPHVLAGPLHLHTREDEYSLVLEGRLGALLGGEQVTPKRATSSPSPAASGTRSGTPVTPRSAARDHHPGRPRGPLQEVRPCGDGYDPEKLPALAEEYGCELDFEGTAAVAERLGLTF